MEVTHPQLHLPHPVEFAGAKSHSRLRRATGWSAARLGLEIALLRGSRAIYRLMELQPM